MVSLFAISRPSLSRLTTTDGSVLLERRRQPHTTMMKVQAIKEELETELTKVTNGIGVLPRPPDAATPKLGALPRSRS